MRGASRDAAIVGKNALASAVAGGADTNALAEDLFAVASVLDTNSTLRRALAEPASPTEAKRAVVQRLFSGKVGSATEQLLSDLVAQRWSSDLDLPSTVDTLGVQAVLSSAEKAGRLQQVEDELFRFDQIVADSPELEDAVTNRQSTPAAKAAIIDRLLQGKSAPETERLARQAVLAPRGQKFASRVTSMLKAAAERRDQLTAIVTTATELDQAQRARLAASLQSLYGKQVQIQTVIDPQVIGGLKVAIGDEVIDGTVARKLDSARQHLAG
ncbi:F0F1 ATP synthase subunit delta [Kribbia dieselivorans]|uniref:F0F1 ATP synthase subunit delta n=1 Tax=Kribbia dieselivorans TaxID=331526 RepID=UPI0008386C21|nr:F0F1 ATP synthase subunit delta [Kribbia dieselivorans]